MCKVHHEVDCCNYKEKLAKKARKNSNPLIKKNEKTRNGCCLNSSSGTRSNIKSKSCYSLKKTNKKVRKNCKKPCDVSNILFRIKPSYDDREKYLDAKHILCVLEKEDIVKLVTARQLSEKLAKNEFCNENNTGFDSIATENERSLSSNQKITADESTSKNTENSSITVKGKRKQVERDMKKSRKMKALGECTSICSLDCELNLAEFSLTKEEIKKIEKNRKNSGNLQDDVKNDIQG